MESFHINAIAFLHLLFLSFSELFSELFSINCTVFGQCPQAESLALLQLKRGFTFVDQHKTWIPKTNCCNWEGVTCDEWRRVIGLDLSNQLIEDN
ncbi:hypothetical protein IEQ34_000126 [Dendrobium chrysotoxum]|uniref:Leucine-rich repeat-containing N-terminal plant-type domain-containing protein n=1 Tax=Dendrobium chrysotoxum TaxID=161865 RepID=A0AAV7HS91_DENCH|nr:hypothetical protein IEQ34_000126 [Dendrobium chrysotoxum]